MGKYKYHEDEDYEKFTDPSGCYQFIAVLVAAALAISALAYTGAIEKIINLFK